MNESKPKQLYLVDTCVFVDFLRSQQKKSLALEFLIREELVVLSCFVRLELLQGAKVNEQRQLSNLLEAFRFQRFSEDILQLAETLLPIARRGGFSFGLIDYFIVLQCLSSDYTLFTFDQTMQKLAHRLEVKTLKQ